MPPALPRRGRAVGQCRTNLDPTGGVSRAATWAIIYGSIVGLGYSNFSGASSNEGQLLLQLSGKIVDFKVMVRPLKASTWCTRMKEIVNASLAFRVAKVAGVPVDDVLTGKYPSPGTCPRCGLLRGGKVTT
jgi:hypothetical protein